MTMVFPISSESNKISGVTTISGSLLIRRKLGIIKEKKIDLVMIDWRYVTFQKANTETWGSMVHNRQRPPARSGLFGGRIRRELLRNLQKFYTNRHGNSPTSTLHVVL